MVACHLNFQFQVLAFLKGTKELGVTHFIADVQQGSCLVKKVLKRIWTFKTKSYNSVLQ
jgi:hypothetical protein